MSATFTWSITRLTCKAQEGELADVVHEVNYVCEAEQLSEGETFKALVNNGLNLPAPTDSFIPYSELTQEQVLAWVWSNGVEKEKLEASLQMIIDKQINPAMVSSELPWSAQVSQGE